MQTIDSKQPQSHFETSPHDVCFISTDILPHFIVFVADRIFRRASKGHGIRDRPIEVFKGF